jgi:hypothetical protein
MHGFLFQTEFGKYSDAVKKNFLDFLLKNSEQFFFESNVFAKIYLAAKVESKKISLSFLL